MSDRKFIYALIDPNDSQIRYVGKTGDPESRLRSHVTSSAQHCRTNPERSSWISELISNGQTPMLRVLKDTSVTEWTADELLIIRVLRAEGHPLTNIYPLDGRQIQRRMKAVVVKRPARSVSLPANLWERVDYEAERNNWNRSLLIQEAVKFYFKFIETHPNYIPGITEAS